MAGEQSWSRWYALARMIQADSAVLLAAQAWRSCNPQHLAGEYAKKDAAAFAAEFEEPSRALFRYRAAMAGLMQSSPG